MKKRPNRTEGPTIRLKTGCGSLYVTQAEADDYKEIFLRIGKSGVCPSSFLDGIARLITFGYNSGMPNDIIIKAFIGLRCPNPMWDGNKQHLSCLDAIAQLLQEQKEENNE